MNVINEEVEKDEFENFMKRDTADEETFAWLLTDPRAKKEDLRLTDKICPKFEKEFEDRRFLMRYNFNKKDVLNMIGY